MSKVEADTGITFARRAGDLPQLSFLGPLLAEAEDFGLAATLATRVTGVDLDRQVAKRRHDIKGALRTLGFTVAALQNGYRFDDAQKDAKIAAIAKAVTILARESELALAVLGEA